MIRVTDENGFSWIELPLTDEERAFLEARINKPPVSVALRRAAADPGEQSLPEPPLDHPTKEPKKVKDGQKDRRRRKLA